MKANRNNVKTYQLNSSGKYTLIEDDILDEVEKARRRLIANVNFEVAIEMLLMTIKENGKVW